MDSKSSLFVDLVALWENSEFSLYYQTTETEIGRDFMLVLKKEYGRILVPVLIHRDDIPY